MITMKNEQSAKKLNAAGPEEKITTRSRILETALVFFNQSGVQGTAVLKIAHALDISPGNLGYHFKSKSEIVLELAKVFRKSVEETILGLKAPLQAEEVISRLETVLRALWRYRFLFNSAIHVSRMDTELASQIKELQRFICEILEKYFEVTISRGEMRRPSQSDGVALLSQNILAVWLQWLRAKNIEQPEQLEADKSSLRECMRSHYSLIDPYIGRDFSQASWKEIERRYGAY
jgi:AcrR family transcriptional regulator